MKGRILVIDDDLDIREGISEILKAAGYEVDAVGTALEGIEKSKQKIYHIAFIDIVLPDMSGIDLLTKLEERVPKTKKVIITGFATLENAVQALNLGADAYLIKPVMPEKILEIVEKMMKKIEEEITITQEKIVKFIESRVKTLENVKGNEK
ncbi:MAG: response regulator [Candidatus Methanomethyliaceae archaeon]|nr:response regulator [Candidatus Methanomethyliaceae archaeon]MDW7971347.1 response regulator [Nitrososphaerota archaeon]